MKKWEYIVVEFDSIASFFGGKIGNNAIEIKLTIR